MNTLITIIHCITCAFLVLFVLIQSGKGAEISASFGGSSQTVFGSSGGANVFAKITGILAAIFFTTSIVLTIMGGQSRKSLFEASPFSANNPTNPVQAPAAPAAPGAPQGAAPAAPQGAAPAAPESKPAAPAAPAQH
ncbi:MAG: preprotein translocase subunit SecG [Bdellovibrionia bacterium]